jgi:hypothetical protein
MCRAPPRPRELDRRLRPRVRGVDIRGCARDTRVVYAFGRSRQRLAGVLNSAFAEGLLSEQTHVHRLGLLFGPSLVDPQQLIGDLTLRRRRQPPLAAARHAWRALTASLRDTTGFGRSSAAPLVGRMALHSGDILALGAQPIHID